VRSQLKSVMAKTGVNRQVELVSLLSGAALLRS
jgi:DNA-binding CsgD family transcriptional regulator